MENAGFEIEIALTGAVGVNVAAERRLDLLLADEAVEDFRNVCKIKDPAAATYRLPTVVIAADAKPSKDDVGRLVPFAVLPREFDDKELVDKITRAVKFSRKLKRKVVA